MIYLTSDWHLFDTYINKYCNRPFKNEEELNRLLINNFNNVTKPGDVIYFLGDLTGNNMGIVNQINLKSFFKELDLNSKHIYLILGNHDNLDISFYFELGFSSVINLAYRFNYKDKEIILTHDPAICQQEKYIYCCGHVHNLFKYINNKVNVYNVGLEVNNYNLVSLDNILSVFNNKVKKK